MDKHVAKELFPPSPTNGDGKRMKKTRKPSIPKSDNGFHLGAKGVFFSVVLCGLAVVCTLLFNGEWLNLTKENIRGFFSNRPLTHTETDILEGSYLFGYLGALHIAVVIGTLIGLGTFIFMFYDSAVPGNFPPTPVTPSSSSSRLQNHPSRWHLGYIMVPVNAIVFFSLSLYYFRLHFGLSFS